MHQYRKGNFDISLAPENAIKFKNANQGDLLVNDAEGLDFYTW